MLRIATWNVNSIRVRLEQLGHWLRSEQPDLVALQETKVRDADFPATACEALGYHVLYSGERTYNGVAILARRVPEQVIRDLPGLADPQRRLLCARYGELTLVNVYVPNGAAVGSEKYRYKLAWLASLKDYAAALVRERGQVILLGDFNIAPADEDVHDPAAWAGSVLVSPPEREALQAILTTGLADTFRLFEQPSASFSWWDYRGGAFRRNHGLRIDLILASEGLKTRCQRCTIEKSLRALPQPSDHAPAVLELSEK